MKQLFVLIVPLLIRVHCVPSLILTTEPFSMGSFCPRPVNITCTGTEISTVLLWKNGSVELVEYGYRSTHNGSFPRTVILEVPLQGVTAEVTTATLSSTAIDIVSTLFVVNVSVLDGYSISCEDNLGRRSEELNIRVQPQDIPPSPSGASCSVLSSTGGPSVVLELDPSFIMDYAVESYTVTVDPATSLCSNNQLSPNDGYSCTGLTVGTSYTFSISAVNCVDQIGATHTITVHPQIPSITSDVTVTYTSSAESTELNEVFVQWEHVDQPVISEGCSFNEELNYTVVLEDNGTIIEQRVISSDSCVNGFCETTFVSTSSNSYVVRVTATNGIGLSSGTVESSTCITVDVRLTSVNIALLVLGVILLCVATAGFVVLLLKSDIGKCTGSMLPLVVGGVMIVVSVVLLVAMGFQVGLQGNTCDSAWQGTRNNLIIAAFVFSIFALLTLATATIILVYFGKCKGDNPEVTKIKEAWEKELDQHEGKVEREQGGRVKELETPQVLVDEFKVKGEKLSDGGSRAAESIFQQYDAQVDEYAALEHNIPPVKVAATNPDYSKLDTPENTEDKEKYSILNHEQDKKKSGDKANQNSGSYSRLDVHGTPTEKESESSTL